MLQLIEWRETRPRDRAARVDTIQIDKAIGIVIRIRGSLRYKNIASITSRSAPETKIKHIIFPPSRMYLLLIPKSSRVSRIHSKPGNASIQHGMPHHT